MLESEDYVMARSNIGRFPPFLRGPFHRREGRRARRNEKLTMILGEVPEWSNGLAWKACVPQGTEGSNPSLSAIL